MSEWRHPIETIVARGQCMGCGFCTLIKPSVPDGSTPRVSMEFDEKLDQFAPVVRNWAPGEDIGEFVCPGAEMDMPSLSQIVYGHEPSDVIIGDYIGLRAAYANDGDLRSRAASGGVVPALLQRLFDTHAIDAAYCVRSGGVPITARGTMIFSTDELSAIHGSVYHPVNFGDGLRRLIGGSERFAFVGLPCEVAGLEMLKRLYPELGARHVISIGLFCGGINAFGGIAYYLSNFGIEFRDLVHIAYRHGPWPGKIRATMKNGEVHEIARIRGNTRWNILKYVIAFQGYWMLPRCRLCPDQVADFADIAVGDPHLPRFRNQSGLGFSIAISRTKRGENIIGDAIEAGVIVEQSISRDEAVASQGYTLDNRRHVRAYVAVAKRLGMVPPRICVYGAIVGHERWRHYRSAIVDLVKLVSPKNRAFRLAYIPWQVFEYLFITLAPSIVGRRLTNLLRNRGRN